MAAVLLVAGCASADDDGAGGSDVIEDVSDADRPAACSELAHLAGLPEEARSALGEAPSALLEGPNLLDDLGSEAPTSIGGGPGDQLERLRGLVEEDLTFVLDREGALVGAGFDLIVYLRPDTTTTVIDEINDELMQDSTVDEVVFFDQQDASEEFSALFADEPELVESVRPEDLPPSFRLVLADPVSDSVDRVTALLDRVEVREAVRGPTADPVDHEREISALRDRIAEAWNC